MLNLPDSSNNVRTEQLLPLGIAYIACDDRLQITELSLGAAALLALPAGALVGRSVTMVCLPLAGSEEYLDAICRGAVPHLVLEQINVEDEDGTRYVSLVVLPHDAGLLVTISDVTMQSYQQQRVQQQHHELLLLHDQLAAQNRQLTVLNNELADLTQRKSDMLAIATHDLRSPLTTTIGYAEMILEGVYGATKDEQRPPLEVIVRQGRHMLDLINALLDLRRLETDAPQSRHPLDLTLLLAQVVRSFIDQSALAQVAVCYAAPATPVVIVGDREMIQQAVVNLVSNGLKYTGKGGTVTLGVQQLLNTPLLDPPLASEQWCALTVADNGPGIAADDLARIFDPFFRTNEARVRGQAGSGLGLAIVQNAVRQHAGRVEVTSRLGAGTTFTLYLPCVAAAGGDDTLCLV